MNFASLTVTLVGDPVAAVGLRGAARRSIENAQHAGHGGKVQGVCRQPGQLPAATWGIRKLFPGASRRAQRDQYAGKARLRPLQILVQTHSKYLKKVTI